MQNIGLFGKATEATG